jgi:hypothetical protein
MVDSGCSGAATTSTDADMGSASLAKRRSARTHGFTQHQRQSDSASLRLGPKYR